MAKIKVEKKDRGASKREIQSFTGWDTKQYNKEYDKFRNRVRAYEKTVGITKKESVAYLFHDYAYKLSKGRRQSGKIEQILATPSYSSGRKIAPAAVPKFEKGVGVDYAGSGAGRGEKIARSLLMPFNSLMKRSPKLAEKILSESKTTQEALDKFSAYAKKVHKKINGNSESGGDAGGGGDITGDFYED